MVPNLRLVVAHAHPLTLSSRARPALVTCQSPRHPHGHASSNLGSFTTLGFADTPDATTRSRLSRCASASGEIPSLAASSRLAIPFAVNCPPRLRFPHYGWSFMSTNLRQTSAIAYRRHWDHSRPEAAHSAQRQTPKAPKASRAAEPLHFCHATPAYDAIAKSLPC